MTWLYLVRHGQADRLGKNYDQLTKLGWEQGARLGRYFSQFGIEFDQVRTGSLNRQKETAQAILAELSTCKPDPKEDENWNEFESRLWLGIAAKIRDVDPQFLQTWERYKQAQEGGKEEARSLFQVLIGQVLRDWVEERWKGEEVLSFEDYCNRIQRAKLNLPDANSILVVTSSTPCAVFCGQILGRKAGEFLPLMKHIHNTSLSIFKKVEGVWELVSWNSLPHLTQPELCSLG